MAEVLYGSMKYDNEVFEAGMLASKLPKAAREHARNVGFLVPGPKKAKAPELEAEAEANGNEPDDEE